MTEELQLRNYADFTIEPYLDAVRSFAKFVGRSPDQAGPEQIREYLLHLVKDRKAFGVVPAPTLSYSIMMYRIGNMARKPKEGPASDPELLTLTSLAEGPKHG